MADGLPLIFLWHTSLFVPFLLRGDAPLIFTIGFIFSVLFVLLILQQLNEHLLHSPYTIMQLMKRHSENLKCFYSQGAYLTAKIKHFKRRI